MVKELTDEDFEKEVNLNSLFMIVGAREMGMRV